MPEAELRPVRGAPALRLGPARASGIRSLVIADLHLGLGATPERPLGPPEANAPRLAAEILDLARREGARRLILAGDTKHPIVGVPRPLRRPLFDFFAELLAGDLRVELVLGNHDGGIARHLPREVDVVPATGYVREGVGIFHGHRWPSAAVLRAKRLVAGHLHPGVRFAATVDDPATKRRCWLRVEFPSARVPRRGRRRIGARELVVVPAFNPVAGAEALNRDRPERGRTFLYRRFLSHGVVRAYLLDGTDVGTIPIPRRGPRARSRS